MMHGWISPFGIPKSILTDRGGEFINAGLRYVCYKWGIRKLATTGRIPWANGVVERFHRVMNASLAMMAANHKEDWEFYLDAILFSYRVTKNTATGFTPYELMFGRQAVLPMDVLYGLDKKEDCASKHEYAEKMVDWLHTAYTLL